MLNRLSMPYLEEVKEVAGYPVWVNSQGAWGVTLSLTTLDAEPKPLTEPFQKMGDFFRNFSPGVKLEWHSRTRAYHEERNHMRTTAINQVGALNTELFLSITEEKSSFSFSRMTSKVTQLVRGEVDFSRNEQEVKALLEKIDFGQIRNAGFDPLPATIDQVRDLWPWGDHEVGDFGRALDFGPSLVTVLRLWKPGNLPIRMSTLAEIKSAFKDEVDFVVKVSRVGDAKSVGFLKRKQKQAEGGTGIVDAVKAQDAEEWLSSALLEGAKLYRVEWLAILQRNSEERLRGDALGLSRELRKIGEIYQETVGCAKSYIASLPGSPYHATFLEKDIHLPFYLPLASFGRSQKDVKSISPHALCVGRRDGSLDYIDFWQSENLNYSGLLGGPAGSGKSVYTQAQTMALIHNPNIRVLKVDAGSSAADECKRLGGVHHQFKLGQPAGINPFDLIRIIDERDPDELSFLDETLPRFIETLILDNDETSLPKDVLADLENEVIRFIRLAKFGHYNGEHYKEEIELSMDGFLKVLSPQFHEKKRKLLARWATGGKYAAILKSTPEQTESLLNNRYHYFDFVNIGEASDKDFTQAAIALVMIQASLESILAKKTLGMRFAFICDETKFFFTHCISFFVFTVSNVRKLGQFVLLINQETSYFLIPREKGEGRLSLFNNTQTHILFGLEETKDGEEKSESFASRHRLTDHELRLIQSLTKDPPHYSEFFIKDGKGGRVVRLSMTPDEYWLSTSHPDDREKKEKIQRAVPELTRDELVAFLSIFHAKVKLEKDKVLT